MDNPTFDQLVKTADLADTRPTGKYEESWNKILDNQLEYCNDANSGKLIGMRDRNHKIEYKITKAMLPHLEPLWNFVAVQPMEGPVGVCYTLQYKYLDDEDRPRQENEGRRLSLQILSQPVEARSLKLSARLNYTDEQDLDGDVATDDVIEALGLEIANETISCWVNTIEILAFKDPEYGSGHIKRHYEDEITNSGILSCTINQHSSDIARMTRRGCGNFIIVNKAALDALTADDDYTTLVTDFEPTTGEDCVLQEVGVLNTMNVFLNTLDKNEQGKVLVGYKGPTETDAGLFYQPYIPIMMTGPVINPVTFQPMESFMTRYGQSVVERSAEYYSGFTFEDKTS